MRSNTSNHPIKATSLLLAVSLLMGAAVSAQSYGLKKSAEELSGPQQQFFAMPGGDILNITWPWTDERGPVTVSLYDHNQKQKYTHENKELFRDNYRGAVQSNGRLYLLCSNGRNDALQRYEINPATGAITGAPSPVFDLPGKEEDCYYYPGNSPNNNWHYLLAEGFKVKHEKGMVLQGVILDLQCNKTATFSYATPEDRDDFESLNILQNDKGSLVIIYTVKLKITKQNKTARTYNIVTVDPAGKTGSFVVTGLPQGDLGNPSWTLEDNRLAFNATLAVAETNIWRSVCSGTIDLAQKKLGDFRMIDVATLMAQAPDPFKWLPVSASLFKTLQLPDGSRAMLMEVHGEGSYQSHYAPVAGTGNAALGNGTMNSYSITYQQRNNLYVLKVDKQGTPQWMDVITKKQDEADFVVAIGTAAYSDSKGNIHLFFVDNKKNTLPAALTDKSIVPVNGLEYKKNMLACVTVTPDGTIKKDFIEDQDDHEFRPNLEKAIAFSENDICFMAVKIHKAFTKEKALNHSKFRLGEIAIK